MREALAYASLGIAVFPVKPGTKDSPMLKEWQRRASSERSMVRNWWGQWTRANIAVHAGKSGLAVIDVDPRNGGAETLAALEEEHGPLWELNCLQATTPSGGEHYVFRAPEGVKLPGKLGTGIDLLHGNHYFMVAPSSRADGAYRWAAGQGPFDDGVFDRVEALPSWCYDSEMGTTVAPAAPAEEVDALAQDVPSRHEWPSGAPGVARFDAVLRAIGMPPKDRLTWRNDIWAGLATGLPDARERLRVWSMLDLDKWDEEIFDSVCDSDDPDRTTKITSGTFVWRAQQTKRFIDPNVTKDPERPDGGREDCTDVGNVNVLIRLSAGNLRHIRETKQWALWVDEKWMLGHAANGPVRDLALQVAEDWRRRADEMEAQAKEAKDADRKRLLAVADSYRKYAQKCRSKPAMDAMLALAPSDSRISLSASVLNVHAHLLGCGNGVIDLATGQLRQDARENYITLRVPYPYDPDAQAPNFERFIDEITGLPDGKGYTPRPELRDHLHKLIGYMCTGLTREQVMAVALGTGSNGKNVLLDLVMHILAAYAAALPPEALLTTSKPPDGDRPTPTLAALQGVRLAMISETKDGARLDVAVVKRHTGGGFVTARALNSAPISFELSHKLVLMTNVVPAIEHLDDAMRGRLQIIPFDMVWNRPGHPDPDPSLPDGDKNLPEVLRAESPGVLAWMVRGAVAYFRDGLRPPEVVAAKTRAYLAEQGHVAQWIDMCTRVPWKEGTRGGELFDSYLIWCKTCGITKPSPATLPKFRDGLTALKVEMGRDMAGSRYGLKVTDWTSSM